MFILWIEGEKLSIYTFGNVWKCLTPRSLNIIYDLYSLVFLTYFEVPNESLITSRSWARLVQGCVKICREIWSHCVLKRWRKDRPSRLHTSRSLASCCNEFRRRSSQWTKEYRILGFKSLRTVKFITNGLICVESHLNGSRIPWFVDFSLN